MNQASVCDLPDIESALIMLQKFVERIPQELSERMRSVSQHEARAFLANLRTAELFPPMRAQVREEADPVVFGDTRMALVRQRVNRCLAIAESARDEALLERKAILNGAYKEQMVEWWLVLIKTRVREFLAMLDYTHGAIPDNYLDEKPEDIAVVKKNLAIIKEIVKAGFSADAMLYSRVQELLSSLKGQIYPFLLLFQEKATAVLRFELEFENDVVTDVVSFQSMLKMVSEYMTEDRRECISRVIKDIEYVSGMMDLEKQALQPEKDGYTLSDIVPISGLILSHFYRAENEFSTVLEVWDR